MAGGTFGENVRPNAGDEITSKINSDEVLTVKKYLHLFKKFIWRPPERGTSCSRLGRFGQSYFVIFIEIFT